MSGGQQLAWGFILLLGGAMLGSWLMSLISPRPDLAYLWILGICMAPAGLFCYYCRYGELSRQAFQKVAVFVVVLVLWGGLLSLPVGLGFAGPRSGFSIVNLLWITLAAALCYLPAHYAVRWVFRLAKHKRRGKDGEQGRR